VPDDDDEALVDELELAVVDDELVAVEDAVALELLEDVAVDEADVVATELEVVEMDVVALVEVAPPVPPPPAPPEPPSPPAVSLPCSKTANTSGIAQPEHANARVMAASARIARG